MVLYEPNDLAGIVLGLLVDRLLRDAVSAGIARTGDRLTFGVEQDDESSEIRVVSYHEIGEFAFFGAHADSCASRGGRRWVERLLMLTHQI